MQLISLKKKKAIISVKNNESIIDNKIAKKESIIETKISETIIDNKTENKGSIYQAIGLLYGCIYIKEETGRQQFFIRLDTGDEFFLYVPQSRRLGFTKQIQANPKQYLMVYPCMRGPADERKLYFQVHAWNTSHPEGFTVNQFVFKGIYQKLPQYRFPVFSVYRNFEPGRQLKGNYVTHLPLMWKVDGKNKMAFKFNPKFKDNKPKFDSILVKFLPRFSSFGFIVTIEPPSESLPKRFKRSEFNETKTE